MDKAIVPGIGVDGDDPRLPLWASSVGLPVEVVKPLIAARRDLHSVLTEAQERQIQNLALVQHLREAEHKACRIEDLVGAMEYYRIQGEVEDNERHDDDHDGELVHDIGDGNPLLSTPGTDIQLFHKAGREVSNTCLLPHPEGAEEDISRAIEEYVVECNRIVSNVRDFLKLEELDDKRLQIYQHSTSWTDPREMSSFPTQRKVHGRDQDRECIISKLTSEESAVQNLSVLAIVGNGGVGKTTLAAVVYNDPVVRGQFDKVLWLHVSVYFNEAKITHELLQLLCGDRYEHISNMKELQNILGYEIKSKRVLLVLDDMWEDNKKENWDVLLTPLSTNDAKGNMVIITTRKSSVARMTGAAHNIILHGLKDEEFWPLFKECAFGDENHQGHWKLQEIGRKIADKLKGYPLAAKSVGKLLSRRLDDGHWNRILDNSEWKDQKGDDDIMPALKISYNYLPRHLQKCFWYCSIFPKNQRYHAQWLVNIWIAQGFIPLAEQAEETGRRYLADLIDWGFFLSEPPRPSLLIHDLVHDLALMVSSHESVTIEEDLKPPSDSKLIRHVTVITESAYYGQFDGTIIPKEDFVQEFADTFCTLPTRDLRTLMLFGAHDSSFASTFQQELINNEKMRAVRVLNMEMLPEAICKLYHLQVLDIKDFNPETVVPKGLHKLRNLRHFFAREQLHTKIASVGDLIFLQELNAFDVGKGDEFRIGQLEKLNEIRGALSICNLQNIESKEEANKARLSDKQYLTSLRLSWDDMPRSLGKLNIIDGLEPPMGLEKLHVDGYNGSAPSWLGGTLCLTSLQVQIRDWVHTKLPPFPIADTTTDIDVWNACSDYMSFRLSSADDESRLCLKLELEGHRHSLDQIEILDETILRFSKLKDLQEVEIRRFPKVRYLPWEGLQQMTTLKIFKMVECTNLFSSNPKLLMPTSVEEMVFGHCDITEAEASMVLDCSLLPLSLLKLSTTDVILNIDGCDALHTLGGSHPLTSLKQVCISTNPVLSSVELHSCLALEKLHITKCPALASWQDFRSLTGVKFLQVSESAGFVLVWKSVAEEMMRDSHNFSMPLECLEIDDPKARRRSSRAVAAVRARRGVRRPAPASKRHGAW
ncbi:hypothetical protein U9M48_002313 [Paspalum notatum var. saurae]|uniref:NB-ARC domain-containing protein n=1 Tax=Paspalum notatum var. saurae TaxID=547442 RepID=A0AAQ3PKS3_PASNO